MISMVGMWVCNIIDTYIIEKYESYHVYPAFEQLVAMLETYRSTLSFNSSLRKFQLAHTTASLREREHMWITECSYFNSKISLDGYLYAVSGMREIITPLDQLTLQQQGHRSTSNSKSQVTIPRL